MEVDENAKDIEQEKENLTGAQQVAIEVTGASRAATTPALLDAGEGGLAHVTEPEPKVVMSRSSLFFETVCGAVTCLCLVFCFIFSRSDLLFPNMLIQSYAKMVYPCHLSFCSRTL